HNHHDYILSPKRHTPQLTSTLFPYTTLFRSNKKKHRGAVWSINRPSLRDFKTLTPIRKHRIATLVYRSSKMSPPKMWVMTSVLRSEEYTSELQSRGHLVCRLLLEKKNFILHC